MSLIIKEMLRIGEVALAEAGCRDSRIDAELIMCHLLELDRNQLYLKYPLMQDERVCDAYFSLIDERAAGKPVQYIIGYQDFLDQRFIVTPDVLIPRQETELLVIELYKELKQQKSPWGGLQILDLCCGSGVIGLSLAKRFEQAKVTLADISPAALAIARRNAEALGVDRRCKFVESDLFGAFRKRVGKRDFHAIAANPPYIKTAVISTLQREIVEHEPLLALDGGDDGLVFYKRIIADAAEYLQKGGWLIMEIGYDQGAIIREIVEFSGKYDEISVLPDLAGRDRIFKCRAV